MGSMSMSDAAPLPRLGEVFFDVRSTSRSLRISWYADTGVAVLSIWQGGTCTGSFRLPMGDLPRMIETLQRGPDGRAGAGESYAQAGQGYAPAGAEDYPPQTREAGHADAAAATSYDPYPAGTGSLHYLSGSGPGHYPDENAADYPDSAARPGYPGEPMPDRYPGEPMPARYPDEPGPADYPVGVIRRDFAAEPPGGQYPISPYADGPYPDGPYPDGPYADGPYPDGPQPDGPQPAPGTPYGDGQPARAGEQPAPGWDSTAAVPDGNGLEPPPESFPYGEPRGSHQRR